MSLGDVLRRKASDYGYKTIGEMALALGMDESAMYCIASGECLPALKTRRILCRELDISPVVMERMVRRG
jgi:hypothetical protein